MAKRISTDAKIVLQNAGYVVEYVYKDGKVSGLGVWEKPFTMLCQLPVVHGLVENEPIEELIKRMK